MGRLADLQPMIFQDNKVENGSLAIEERIMFKLCCRRSLLAGLSCSFVVCRFFCGVFITAFGARNC